VFTCGAWTDIVSSSSTEPGDTAGVLLRTPTSGWTLLCGMPTAFCSLSAEPPGSSKDEGGEKEPTPSRDRFMEDSERRSLMLHLKRWRLLEALWFTAS